MAVDLLDLLHQASGWVGGAGAAVISEVYRRFRSAEKSAKTAVEAVEEIRALLAGLRKVVEESTAHNERIRQGIRLELDQFRSDVQKKLNEIDERELRLSRGSRPDVMSVEELQRQIDQLRGRLEEMKGDFGRERDQNYATVREEAKWKADLNRSLGSIETQIEILMEAANRRS
jgi:chromosome segregation ATPase